MSNSLKSKLLEVSLNNFSQEEIDNLFEKLLYKVTYEKLTTLLKKPRRVYICYKCRQIHIPDGYGDYDLHSCGDCHRAICDFCLYKQKLSFKKCFSCGSGYFH